MADKKIKKLITTRNSLVRSVEKIVKDLENAYNGSVVQGLANLNGIYKTLCTQKIKIEKMNDDILELEVDEDNIDKYVDDQVKFEIYIEEQLEVLQTFINKDKMDESKKKMDTCSVKLPRLELKKFDGEPTKWQAFQDSFNAAVGSSKSISNVEKLNYLQGFLEGDALRCISGLALTGDNYKEAITVLQNRFGNPQLIISTHMNAMVKIPPITIADTTKLRSFFDKIETHVRSLLAFKINMKDYGCMLATIILEKLPLDIKLLISRNFDNGIWDLAEILKILDREIKARENCMIPSTENSDVEDSGKWNSDITLTDNYTGASLVSNNIQKMTRLKQNKCVFCNGNHWSDKCKIVSDLKCRKEFLKINRLCFVCLGKGHLSRNCEKSKRCFFCKSLSHNSAICEKADEKHQRQKSEKEECSANVSTSFNTVLLQTAALSIVNPQNKRTIRVKALFDQGSQRSYISKRVKEQLKLKVVCKENLSINTFGNNKIKDSILEKVSFELVNNKKECFSLEALSTEVICLPIKTDHVKFSKETCDHLKGLDFADSGESGDSIELLIGSDFYWSLVTGHVRIGKEGEPVGIKTHFGWVLNGPVKNVSRVNCSNTETIALLVGHSETDNLEMNVNRFWDLETLGISENEFSNYETFTNNSIYLNESKRYETLLPFKENHEYLNDNFEVCEKRLRSLHMKLKRDPELLRKYDAIFKEQMQTKIIEGTLDVTTEEQCHYLPHHAVIREDHDTTKLRIVFDASSKVTGPSLNECLYKGPQLTPLIFDILLRFRTFLVALTADIEKAFLQISINPQHRDFLRFLWFDDAFADEPKIVRNRFARLVFGVTSSPFLLNGTVRKHTEQYAHDQVFVQKVLNSFYVDDFTGGVNSIEEALELFKKLKLRFLEGSFNLRKWRTNDAKLRKFIEPLNGAETPSKILGINWDEVCDVFSFDFKHIWRIAETLKPTKRTVLKILAMFYDPIGLIQPVIVHLKILFQDLCRQKLGWDDELPSNLENVWTNYLQELKNIDTFEIPRIVVGVGVSTKVIELHGFSDASLKSYGACVYLRCVCNNDITVHLIAAKSRIAPMKSKTIPRLELMGNLVLTRLMNAVKGALEKEVVISGMYYWTDSKVSLSWITSLNKEFKTFVENRVQEIRSLSEHKLWFYCKTSDNPADLLTRPDLYLNLKQDTLWWKGPNFLSEYSLVWPDKNEISDNYDTQLPEIKTCVSVDGNNYRQLENLIDLQRFGSVKRLYRVTAWVLRFVSNLKKRVKNDKVELSLYLNASELSNSEIMWIRENQNSFGKDKIEVLSKQLNLIRDENNLLICKGRLENAPLAYETKYPILLNQKHHLAELIVFSIHVKAKHISIKQMLSEVRQRFWIVKGRSFIRWVLYKCNLCRRFVGPSYKYPDSPPLTKLRLQDKYAFFTTGIDNFGPLYVKNIFKTDTELHKVWVTLYTCAASRGVVFDIVSSPSAIDFIGSFRRFISRRGCPSNVISDGGSNFVSKKTKEFINDLGVTWDVNLPLSPWHGGFFERMVRSTKELLRKVLGTCKLTYDELQTLLLETEAILNNRPLTYFYENETESCLTPNHLLFGRRLEQQNCDVFTDTVERCTVTSYKLQNVIEHFWERWRREYLTSLREQHKPRIDTRNRPTVNIGDVVIIEEDRQPRASWRIAKIERLISSQDGCVRGAVLRLPNSNCIKRPICKLYLVESVNKINKKSETQEVNDIDNILNEQQTETRPRRAAAVEGELRRKFYNA